MCLQRAAEWVGSPDAYGRSTADESSANDLENDNPHTSPAPEAPSTAKQAGRSASVGADRHPAEAPGRQVDHTEESFETIRDAWKDVWGGLLINLPLLALFKTCIVAVILGVADTLAEDIWPTAPGSTLETTIPVYLVLGAVQVFVFFLLRRCGLLMTFVVDALALWGMSALSDLWAVGLHIEGFPMIAGGAAVLVLLSRLWRVGSDDS